MELVKLEWPGSYCSTLPKKPHYFIEVERLGGLAVFRCEYCKRHQFLSAWWPNSMVMDELFRKHGEDEGYRIFLSNYPEALAAAVALQNAWHLQSISDKAQLSISSDEENYNEADHQAIKNELNWTLSKRRLPGRKVSRR